MLAGIKPLIGQPANDLTRDECLIIIDKLLRSGNSQAEFTVTLARGREATVVLNRDVTDSASFMHEFSRSREHVRKAESELSFLKGAQHDPANGLVDLEYKIKQAARRLTEEIEELLKKMDLASTIYLLDEASAASGRCTQGDDARP